MTKMVASPVTKMASSFPRTIWVGRSGAAVILASVPAERSMSSERMPRPLPMKRKTTAMLGAKKLRLTLPPWPTLWVVMATVVRVGGAVVRHTGRA